MASEKKKHVVIIVLGDIGRSPRMNYHALSILQHGHRVSLIGYRGEDILPQLKAYESTLLESILFSPYSPPKMLRRYFLPLYYILRLFGLTFGLCHALAKVQQRCSSPDTILVQNPPTLPLLFISYIFCIYQGIIFQKRPKLVIDWHNLGFTMFGRPKSVITKMAKLFEKHMAPLANGHLCVSESMAQWLVTNFGIKQETISVLYDRPPEFFQPTSVEAMHHLMNKLQTTIVEKCPRLEPQTQKPNKTILTEIVTSNGKSDIVQRKDRPILIVSSTSWTPDEDFSILLNALVALQKNINNEGNNGGTTYPHILVIVTGKGPEKEMYENMILHLNLKHITILTMWLETCDYPKLLGCADLGISLHVSTSGLDLPMKVLDMFGCEVPVCAYNFGCLGELVKDGENGRVFSSEVELAQQLRHLLLSDGKRSQDDNKIMGDLEKFRNNIRGMTSWKENWIEYAHDMILCTDTRDAGQHSSFMQIKIQ
eukprot:CAMPEP_0176487974 /NCGR_PEP_ID=MMETSP0200_2-20121128/6443_1 /TAXON_ID=947934 /ORGANISM="Chaetoceros sp., Strain GSL56" /LENGTH=482 /DNA_ID=CAMNT_0017884889 /DNA_START=35 /DNA_END=1483 /DNA_ORIENTATION=-